MSKRLMAIILVSTSIMSTVAAWAQSTDKTASSNGVPGSSSAVTDEGASQGGSSLTEIVVTAQKREERLVDVPMTVSVVSGQRLDDTGIASLSGLEEVVPALRWDNTGAYGQMSIRGVGSSLTGPGVGSAVGVYVDGFLVPNPLSTDFDLLNVDNVQVLKGPQGTLFGRNTTAGAVLVTTSDPSQATELKAKFSYSRFNSSDTEFYATTGLSDRVAVDLAGEYRHTDGFVRNIFNGDDEIGKLESKTLRPSLKIDLGGGNSLLLRYLYQDVDNPSVSAYDMYGGIGLATIIAPGVPIATTRGEVSLNGPTGFQSKTNAGFLTGIFDLGFAELKSYSMYRDEESNEQIDLDSSPLPIFDANIVFGDKFTTQELDLSSKPGSPVNWLAGFFYFRENSTLPEYAGSIGGGPSTPILVTGNKVTSYAGFADATYELLSKFFVTGGLRYSNETNDAFYDVPSPVAGQPAASYPGHGKWDNLAPRAVLRYELDKFSNVYASFTKGFKAGFINVNGDSDTPIQPEKITSIEAGYKLARGPIRLDVSAYHYKYDNLQVATETGFVAIVTNAARSTLYGGEFDLTAQVTDRLEVSLGSAYTHAKYDSYPDAPLYKQFLSDPSSPEYGELLASSVNASGFQMAHAPEFTGNAAITYRIPLPVGRLALNGNFAYQSKFFFDSADAYQQGGYGLLNVRATWTDPSNRWSFSIFGNNVTDRTYRTTVYGTPFGAQEAYGYPVTYGGEIAFQL